MPRWAKVVVWAVVFILCAAAGAWVASRTDPFPPGVEDPGARPSAAGATDVPSPSSMLWNGQVSALSEHRLRVGGTCRSGWLGTYRMRLRPDGSIGGSRGVVILVPGSARCDFEQAQVQTDSVELVVAGSWERRGEEVVVRLRLEEQGRDPRGSLDVGGLLATLEVVRPVIRSDLVPPKDGPGRPFTVEVSDGNQGTYASTYRFSANCRAGCS